MEERKSEMSKKEDILAKIRANIGETFDMPSFEDMKGILYADTLQQFKEMSKTVGANVIELKDDEDINDIIRKQYPEAKVFASHLKDINIATLNPNNVAEAQDLNGTDVGIVEGEIGVAENGCIWVPQTMKEKAVCFISEYLVILLDKKNIVNNMHEAYSKVKMTGYGYGCFISGPSKTADIAQALVMGAQAARGVTVILK